jgi:hypothetical protein
MDLFCQIYINYERSEKEIIFFLSELMTEDVVIDLRKNDEYQPNSDDFLFFKYILEIDFLTETVNYVQIVGDILLFLWSKQIAAVASCDYENKLPESGGYFGELSVTNTQIINLK